MSSVSLSPSLRAQTAFLILFTKKVPTETTANLVQHGDVSHANNSNKWIHLGDVGDVNKKRSLAVVGRLKISFWQ